MRKLCLLIYYAIAQYLPDNYLPVIGKLSQKVRCGIVRGFCKNVAKTANIQRNVYLMGGVFV